MQWGKYQIIIRIFVRGGGSANLEEPEAFTEKIQWLKLYDNTDTKMLLADKDAVRGWIKEKIGDKYLIPQLGKWHDFEEIDFDKLPAGFCLKMNHGSGMNYPVKDKKHLDKKECSKLFFWWSNRPFWTASLEPQYRYMPRVIIAEKYMEEMDGKLYDYKIHCFHGVPKFIQCIGDRDLKKHTGCQKHYDLHWNELDWTFEDYPRFPYKVPKPDKLEEMLYVAAVLSEGFAYVRVDLYEIRGRVYFGEMTFTPASGIYPYRGSWTMEKDRELGEMIELPDIKNTGRVDK